ncbi:MAG: nitroreductase family protein, partial [Bacteroidia bacterium]
EKMLELANWAPTHKNTEPWRFRVFLDKPMNNLLDLCKECYIRETPAERFNTAKLESIDNRKTLVSHIVAICMDRDQSEVPIPEFEEIASTAMAVQNMWLFLSSTKKYGGYWSSPKYALGEEFREFLKLKESERCLGIFYIGTVSAELAQSSGRRGDWKDKVILHK